jgi:hypothetical protein
MLHQPKSVTPNVKFTDRPAICERTANRIVCSSRDQPGPMYSIDSCNVFKILVISWIISKHLEYCEPVRGNGYHRNRNPNLTITVLNQTLMVKVLTDRNSKFPNAE